MPRSIVRTLVRGQPAARPLFFPLVFTLAARLDNIPLPTFLSNPTKITNALVALHRRLNTDGVTGYFDCSLVAEALGCQLDWSSTPPTILPPAKPSLLANLACSPQELQKRGRIPVALEVIQRLTITLRQGPVLLAALPGPLRLASQLLGEEFIAQLIDQKDEAVDIFDTLTALLHHLAQAFCAAETHLLLIDEETVPEALSATWEEAMTATWNAIRFHETLPMLLHGPIYSEPLAGAPLRCLVPHPDNLLPVPQQPFAVALPVTEAPLPDVTPWTTAKTCALVITDGEIPYQSEIQALQSRVAVLRSTLHPGIH